MGHDPSPLGCNAMRPFRGASVKTGVMPDQAALRRRRIAAMPAMALMSNTPPAGSGTAATDESNATEKELCPKVGDGLIRRL
jgi:hypothetical protein